MNTTKPYAFDTILTEVMEAYCDCHGNLPTGEADKRRNLNFKASQPVTRNEAIEILNQAIPGGYNEFEAHLLTDLPEEAMITIGREASVALYVHNLPDWYEPDRMQLAHDDYAWRDNGILWLWWD